MNRPPRLPRKPPARPDDDPGEGGAPVREPRRPKPDLPAEPEQKPAPEPVNALFELEYLAYLQKYQPQTFARVMHLIRDHRALLDHPCEHLPARRPWDEGGGHGWEVTQ